MVRTLASHQCGPGSNLGVDAICGLSLLLVLFFAPRGFFSGYSGFPSPQKPTFPNSNSTRNKVDEEPLCGNATSKSLFIYYLFMLLLVTKKKTKQKQKNKQTNKENIGCQSERKDEKTNRPFPSFPKPLFSPFKPQYPHTNSPV